jgi:hypothetical protein
MGIKTNNIIVKSGAPTKDEIMKKRNVSLVSMVSKEQGTAIKQRSKEITVEVDGESKIVSKNSKYLEDLTNKGD